MHTLTRSFKHRYFEEESFKIIPSRTGIELVHALEKRHSRQLSATSRAGCIFCQFEGGSLTRSVKMNLDFDTLYRPSNDFKG